MHKGLECSPVRAVLTSVMHQNVRAALYKVVYRKKVELSCMTFGLIRSNQKPTGRIAYLSKVCVVSSLVEISTMVLERIFLDMSIRFHYLAIIPLY